MLSEISLDDIRRIIGQLYLENTMLQRDNIALQARLAECEKAQQESDEREKQDES